MEDFPSKYPKHTVSWCDAIVSTHFMKHMQQMCKIRPYTDTTILTEHTRKKRAIPLAIIGIKVLGYNTIISTGTAIAVSVKGWKTDRIIKEMLEKQAKTYQILGLLLTDLYDIARKFENLIERVDERAIIPFLMKTSVFASRMTNLK